MPSDPAYWGPGSPGALVMGRLRRVRLRIRGLILARFGAIGAAVVAGILALGVLWLRLHDSWHDVRVPWLALCGVLVAAGLVALVWPLSDRTVARHADRRLGLKNRLGTVVALASAGTLTGMERAAIADAAEAVGHARIGESYALRWTRATQAAVLCMAALALMQVLPIPAFLMSDQDQRERAELARRAALMKPAAERLELAAKRAGDAEALELAKRLRNLAKDFQRGKYTKKQALLAHKDLQEKLNAHAEKLREPSTKTAAQAAKQLTKSLSKQMASQAQKMAEQAAKQGNQQAEKRLQELAKKLEEAQTPEELKRLGSELQKAAKDMNMDMPMSPEAAAELAESLAGDKLQEALDKLAQMQEQLQQGLKQMSAEELGQLAEQLSEMAEALSDTELSELADQIKKASDCMKSGDCEGAGEALREAQAGADSAAARMGVAREARDAGG